MVARYLWAGELIMQYTNVMLSYEQLTVARIAISDKLQKDELHKASQAKLRTVYVELTKAKHQLEQERERSW